MVLLYRHESYSKIDSFFTEHASNLLCTVQMIHQKDELNKLFNTTYHVLITYGESYHEYINEVNSVIADRMRKQWIHLKDIKDVNEFNRTVNHCYVHNATHEISRPDFSLFTTCYLSYDKIFRAYNSIKSQTLRDWEWVILDDSPDDDHFVFLKKTFLNDHRIRLYKRSCNSGSIGNVKNEAVSLCRGSYVLEMDHDDEILPDVLMDSKLVFDKDLTVGFIYMDCINLFEDGTNYRFSDYFALGYSGYYRQKYHNGWVFVASTPNINNITLSHIVSVPNHPRIWRKSVLMSIGNYSEYLPIDDDYEVLVRTAANTTMAKIHKFGYIQYMNPGNNNFSLIRNSEINRLIHPIRDASFAKNKIVERMKEKDAYEEEANYHKGPVWKRTDFTHKYCNQVINMDYSKQYCIIGLDTLYANLSELYELYNDPKNDFILLDNIYKSDSLELCIDLDNLGLSRMKCYTMNDCTDEHLVNYFNLIYKSCSDSHIYHRFSSQTLQVAPLQVAPLQVAPLTTTTTHIDAPLQVAQLTVAPLIKMTIITPCIRPENLQKIKESLNFDYIAEWIIVYDGKRVQPIFSFTNNENITEYIYSGKGKSGNPQRNFGLSNVKNPNTYIYFLDDDNTIHPDLYKEFATFDHNKIYTFDQKRPPDVYPFKECLKGNTIRINKIDTAMFMVHYSICRNIEWFADQYNSDGIFIVQCYLQNKEKWVYIDKVLSHYNVMV